MKEAQLVLDLPLPQSWDEADFFVTPGNEHAFRLILSWPEWQSPAAILFGPPQCGKTYLAKIWQSRSKATFVEAPTLAAHVWAAPYDPLIVEDIGAAPFDETALFHHLNLAREHGSWVLLTSGAAPGQWNLSLPDLRSRIRSYPAIQICQPGEGHLAALLVKHFAARQIEVTPEVISYLVARMERSMAAAERLVAAIDRLALSEQRKITRMLAAEVFKKIGAAQEDGADDDENEADI